MRREAILAGAMLLFPFDAFFGQNAPAKTSRIIGIVVDSIHGTGLEGAEVMVSGFSSAVTTDSLGRFVWVDGTQWRMIEPGDIDAFVSPRDVAALEMYRGGTAPVQFRGLNDQCVTLVVWTQMQSQGHAALIK